MGMPDCGDGSQGRGIHKITEFPPLSVPFNLLYVNTKVIQNIKFDLTVKDSQILRNDI